eukprot:g4281.t1
MSPTRGKGRFATAASSPDQSRRRNGYVLAASLDCSQVIQRRTRYCSQDEPNKDERNECNNCGWIKRSKSVISLGDSSDEGKRKAAASAKAAAAKAAAAKAGAPKATAKAGTNPSSTDGVFF